MVDLRASNDKLWDRGARIVATLTQLDRGAAMDLLRRADGHVKVAIVMQQRSLNAEQARQRLTASGGKLRDAMA
jgi:N-acetylmuramic acid 6-phosphate etherase